MVVDRHDQGVASVTSRIMASNTQRDLYVSHAHGAGGTSFWRSRGNHHHGHNLSVDTDLGTASNNMGIQREDGGGANNGPHHHHRRYHQDNNNGSSNREGGNHLKAMDIIRGSPRSFGEGSLNDYEMTSYQEDAREYRGGGEDSRSRQFHGHHQWGMPPPPPLLQGQGNGGGYRPNESHSGYRPSPTTEYNEGRRLSTSASSTADASPSNCPSMPPLPPPVPNSYRSGSWHRHFPLGPRFGHHGPTRTVTVGTEDSFEGQGHRVTPSFQGVCAEAAAAASHHQGPTQGTNTPTPRGAMERDHGIAGPPPTHNKSSEGGPNFPPPMPSYSSFLFRKRNRVAVLPQDCPNKRNRKVDEEQQQSLDANKLFSPSSVVRGAACIGPEASSSRSKAPSSSAALGVMMTTTGGKGKKNAATASCNNRTPAAAVVVDVGDSSWDQENTQPADEANLPNVQSRFKFRPNNNSDASSKKATRRHRRPQTLFLHRRSSAVAPVTPKGDNVQWHHRQDENNNGATTPALQGPPHVVKGGQKEQPGRSSVVGTPQERRVPLTTNVPRRVEVTRVEAGSGMPSDPQEPAVRIFPSCSEAARAMGLNRTKLSRTCRSGGGLVEGYFFRYVPTTPQGTNSKQDCHDTSSQKKTLSLSAVVKNNTQPRLPHYHQPSSSDTRNNIVTETHEEPRTGGEDINKDANIGNDHHTPMMPPSPVQQHERDDVSRRSFFGAETEAAFALLQLL